MSADSRDVPAILGVGSEVAAGRAAIGADRQLRLAAHPQAKQPVKPALDRFPSAQTPWRAIAPSPNSGRKPSCISRLHLGQTIAIFVVRLAPQVCRATSCKVHDRRACHLSPVAVGEVGAPFVG
jgi:hypothetical protein